MFRRLVLCLVSLGAISGCALGGQEIAAAFNPDDAAYIHQKGTGRIEGEAFLRRNDGMVVTAAGSEVYLVPVTQYTQARMRAIYGAGKITSLHPGIKDTPPEFYDYQRATKANSQGAFSFEGLVPAEYYVVTTVLWNAGDISQGGSIYERVSVKKDETTTVIMTGS